MEYSEIVKEAVLRLVTKHRTEFEIEMQSICRENGLKPFDSVVPNFDAHLSKLVKKEAKQAAELMVDEELKVEALARC